MKYTLILVSLLLMAGCSSIKYVTVEHGQIVTDQHQPVDILGNPPVECHYQGYSKVYSGYFMYQDDDGSIVLDDFGRGIIILHGKPICVLSREI